MRLPRRRFLHLAASAAFLPALSRVAPAQSYPTRPLRLVVGFAAGSGADTDARLFGQWLSARLGQPIIIDNRPGAGTNIATESVVRAAADGYTLLYATPANAINATLYAKLDFNFISDIAPVAGVERVPLVMVVTPSLPVATVPEFIAYAKSNPGKISVASTGIGTMNHLAGELFRFMTGVNTVHVPYRGGGGSLIGDLLSGQVQVTFIGMTVVMGDIQTGRLRALGVTSAMRLEALPDIPAIGEFVSGYEAVAWEGIGAPKNTPAEIIEKLNHEINAGLAEPKLKAHLAGLGEVPMPMSAADFAKFIAAETAKWAKVIEFAGIRAE